MSHGRVKWFNNAKGYGFILADDGGEDLFAHYSSIQMDGYRTLKAGQEVAFDVISADRGLHAINIRRLDEAAEDAPHAEADSEVKKDNDESDPGAPAAFHQAR